MKIKSLIVLSLLAFVCIACSSNTASGISGISGVFEGESRAKYTSENFWGVAKVTLENSRITGLEFYIIDKGLNEIFGPKYEEHYIANALYQEQCRNEVAALDIYPAELLKKQSMDKVDAISGATWSYDLMKAAVAEALKKAGIES